MRPAALRKVKPPPFPEAQILPFFMEGLRRGRVGTVLSPPPWSDEALCRCFDLRGFLYFLILCFGSLRASEPLHLYLADVTYDFLGGSGALLILRHPATGTVRLAGGDWRTRKDYLREAFGLRPRNEIVGHQRAGWKNLLLDESEPPFGQHSRVYWVVPEIGHLFWRLHEAYSSRQRARSSSHPYYLTSQKGDSYGLPWALDSAQETFERAIRAIGLRPSSEQGLCMHAMRHRAYSHLRQRGVSPEVRQLVLHQQRVESQDEYGRPQPAEISAKLRAAVGGLGAPTVERDGLPPPPEASRLDDIGRELAANFSRGRS